VNTYIIIPTPKRDSQSGWITNLVAGLLSRVLPSGNPDFSHLYDQVVVFHVEIDSDGSAEREVGLDASGRVITIAPWRENLGVIVDSDGRFDPAEFQHISPEQFEQEWKSYDSQPVA
jgi:hypothetical protein